LKSSVTLGTHIPIFGVSRLETRQLLRRPVNWVRILIGDWVEVLTNTSKWYQLSECLPVLGRPIETERRTYVGSALRLRASAGENLCSRIKSTFFWRASLGKERRSLSIGIHVARKHGSEPASTSAAHVASGRDTAVV